jgi:hypothetical protein
VIDVAIQRGLVARTHEDGIHTNDSAALSDHSDLVIGNVAFDVVIFPRVVCEMMGGLVVIFRSLRSRPD